MRTTGQSSGNICAYVHVPMTRSLWFNFFSLPSTEGAYTRDCGTCRAVESVVFTLVVVVVVVVGKEVAFERAGHTHMGEGYGKGVGRCFGTQKADSRGNA